MILQEFSENICNSHDRPAEGTLAMTGQNEQHTFLGLDGAPLAFISVEVRSATSRRHLHRTVSGHFSLHLDGMLLGTLQLIPAQPPAADTPGQLWGLKGLVYSSFGLTAGARGSHLGSTKQLF